MLKPEQAILSTGRRKDWVARQMGISPSYLSRLLSGDRGWTDRFQRSFAQAVGFSEEAIDFVSDVCSSDTACVTPGNAFMPENPAKAPTTSPVGREGIHESLSTTDPAGEALVASASEAA